jgi:UDP-N-acetylmuramoyl-L-alanyl-D-glutamate--2,6-diaminopimelate ligase
MTLGDLLGRMGRLVPLAGVDAVEATDLARPVTAVEHDSRRVAPGAVFVAVRGQRTDGTAFAAQARERGAVAVVADTAPPADWPTPWLVVGEARLALAAGAAVLAGHPSESLLLVGITGTNGKTTTAHLLASILDAAGRRAGLIGTTGYRVGNVERDAARTTPEAPELQRTLREMVEAGCAACAMEVSSHALALRRADFLRFSAAVFTNLTRDHLDFHESMEAYFLAKRRLFEMLPRGAPAVVNADDPCGVRLATEFRHAVTFGLDRAADVSCSSLSLALDGLRCEIRTPRGTLALASPLVGRPNAYNVLAAATTALALDLPFDAIERGVAALAHVPGRFQTVSGPADDIALVVDYAHTDDALRNLLETARPLTRGRLIVVFGCGGDRDRTKRPLMGAAAARLSDLAVLTSDNPRSEDPGAIIDDIVKGIAPPDRPALRAGHTGSRDGAARWFVEVDRREAIFRAVAEARPGDMVLVAGKGHEKHQEIGGRVLPFDDVDTGAAALAWRRERATAGAGGRR